MCWTQNSPFEKLDCLLVFIFSSLVLNPLACLDIFIYGGFLLVCWYLSLFTSLTYVRAGGKSSQRSQVLSHIWFDSMIVVAGWVCRRSGGHGAVLMLFVISFGRQYVCIVSVQVAKQEKSSLELRLVFRDRRGLCGSETWGKFSKRKRLPGILEGWPSCLVQQEGQCGQSGNTILSFLDLYSGHVQGHSILYSCPFF